jgi:HK97 family phage portal protein
MSTWFYAPQLGQPRGGTPVSVMRQFAQTPQVAMCIKTIIDEISGIPYSIVPKRGYDDSFNEDIKLEIEEFLRYPNRNGESFTTIIKALLKDILEIDAGVIVKTFSNYSKEKQYSFTSYVAKDGEYPTVDIMAKALTTKAKLSEIYCRDAGTFVLNPNEFGILPEDKPAYFQYSWLNHSAKPLPFFKREIVYFNSTPRSNSPYGWSPIESLFMVLESLNNAVRFNKKSFEEYAIPDGALSVIGADKDALARFIQQWKNDVKGKPHKLVIFNEDMKFTPFHQKNKDMEWLEGQKYYQRLVWAMYGVTPDELGFTETSNRSVGESQSRVFVRRAIKPFLQLLQTKITEDIIAEFYDGEIECEIKWDWIDQELEKEEQLQKREDVKTGILTINEVRLDRGLDPVSWGDENPNQPQQQGFGGFDFGDDSFDDFLSDEEELEKTIKKKRKPVRFGPRGGRIIGQDSRGKIKRPDSLELPFKEPTGTKWEDWADYGDFLGGYFNQLDKKIMEIFDEEMTTSFKGQQIWLRKDWGGFLAKITSVFAIAGLKEHIEKYIKRTWNSALEEVEDSLNIQIGIGDSDRVLINQFAEQQTEGYVLPDGNKWLGIQGVNDKIQIQLGDIVQKGVEGGLSVDEVRKNIQLKLDTTRNHAMMIARTETNRIRNRAHLGAYMKSNIPGKIKWDAHLDNRTSEVCEELDGKKVNPGDLFITKDGQEFAYPPAHVNCRSRIIFVPEALEEFEDESE